MSAVEIRAALRCENSRCPCHTEKGLVHCPAHDDRSPSLSVEDRDGKTLVKCFAGCSQDAIIGAIRSRGLWKSNPSPKPKANRREWVIRDFEGREVAKHIRNDLPNGRKEMPWEPKGAKPRELLYGAERLRELSDGSTLILCEGEKSADAVRALGVEAGGTVCGSGTIPNDEVLRELCRFDVYLWPDFAEDGRVHMKRIGERLIALGANSVRILNWEGATVTGDDAADFVQRGGTADELRSLIATARTVSGGAETSGVVRLSDVERRSVSFLWQPYIPYGKLIAVEGRPGVGKSFAVYALVAGITRGVKLPLDDTEREPRNALVFTAEDDLADTVRPRVEALGGDLSRVLCYTPDLSFASDMDTVESLVCKHKPALIAFDTLQAYMTGLDLHRANETRPVLKKLRDIAERHGCAILLIRHTRKSNAGHAVEAGIGTVDISAACRSILHVAEDPDDASRGAVLHVKSNCGPKGDSVGFSIEDGSFGWTGVSTLSYDALRDDRESSPIDEAVEFLQTELAQGPVASRELMTRAKGEGIAERTLRRAKADLRVLARKVGRGGWEWYLEDGHLPDGETDSKFKMLEDGQDGHLEDLAIFQNLTAFEDGDTDGYKDIAL